MDEIQAISDGRQALIMNSNARIREISLAIFDRTFVITNVLYWLAVGVAIIGIFGAMLALQLERGREFGMLRALGMTPLQTGALVALQTGYVGLLAGLLAVPLGLLMGWVLLAVINRRAFGWQIELAATPGPLGWAIVLAAGAALLAGIYPAWQAARVRPALAMREE
jgi:putative ABC transport system permease protein